MFKSIHKFILSVFTLSFFVLTLNTASSVYAAQIDYNNPNNQPIQNPTFNAYTNVPAGVGNEADFVRLRKSNGDPTVPANQNDFSDPLSNGCSVGQKFDIRTYIHNSANTEFNNNGNGSAVAHNVTVAMKAPLGQTAKKFTFESSVSSSNATSVTDTGTLNCDNEVQLKLVPQTVKVYTKHLGWNSATDSAVNGSLKVGSRVAGSGDQWGCWEDRIVVVYVVEVVAKPQPPTPTYTCDAITIEKIGERKYLFGIRYTAINGASLKSVAYDFGDSNSKTVSTTPFSAEHEYAKAGEYKVTTTLTFMVNNKDKAVTDSKCATTIKTSVTPCPINPSLPKDSPDCKETPTSQPPVTEIPSTGAGEIIAGLFGTSATAYGAYAWVASRRALKNIK